jgi:hypothetical protein
MLSLVTLSVAYGECRISAVYAECRYAGCRSAISTAFTRDFKRELDRFVSKENSSGHL